MTTGEKIKMLRKAMGWTQEDLANLVGVKQAAINKYETGLVVNLKRDTIQNLAHALGCSPVFLLDDIDGKSPYDDYVLHHVLTDLGELSVDERDLIVRYRDLSDDGKNYLSQQLSIAAKMFPKEEAL